jgi:hypothetical protein
MKKGMKIVVIDVLFLTVIGILVILAKADMLNDVVAGICLELIRIILYVGVFLVIVNIIYFLKSKFNKEEEKWPK